MPRILKERHEENALQDYHTKKGTKIGLLLCASDRIGSSVVSSSVSDGSGVVLGSVGPVGILLAAVNLSPSSTSFSDSFSSDGLNCLVRISFSLELGGTTAPLPDLPAGTEELKPVSGS